MEIEDQKESPEWASTVGIGVWIRPHRGSSEHTPAAENDLFNEIVQELSASHDKIVVQTFRGIM